MSRMIMALALSFALASGSLALPAPASAQNPERLQEIQIRWPDQRGWELIRSLPDLEVCGIQMGQWIRYVSKPRYTQELADAGLDPQIIWDDLHAHYQTQLLGPGFGSLYTYSEAVSAMDSLHAAYPAITTAKFSIGTSIEGRTIWAMKVSDNPGVDEDEPEVLFDAEHHAREPITVSVVLDFIRFLGSHYGTDPEATFLVNEREIYVVPMVNPDGYVYNETTDPGGGGLWRKNRRDNPGTCDGVDPNRNYSFHWGGGGSSGDPCDETYRGPSPFSEPEVTTLRDFIISRHFVTHNSYHSFAALVLFPWGWTSTLPPELSLWNQMGANMSQDNGYVYGPAYTTIYPADGVAFDWAYGDTTSKPKVYSFTTEVGGSGFWPAEAEIPGLIAENLSSNIYLATVAGPFVTTTATAVTGGNGNGQLDPGESAGLVLTLQNAGVLATANGVTATISSNDAYVQILDATASFGSLAAGASATSGADPFEVVVDPSAPQGHSVVLNVAISWTGGSNLESATLVIGALPVIASDSFEGGNNGWSQDPTHTASTGTWVLIDPNPTSYQPGDDATPPPGTIAWITAQNTSDGVDDVDNGIAAMRSPVWNLSGYGHVKLAFKYFHGQRDAGGDSGDFFRVALSNDGGATYPVNLISLGDATHSAVWTAVEFNLENYLPLTSQMRIRFQASDGLAVGDLIEGGLDDLAITDAGTGNQPPGAPAATAPPHGGTVGTPTPVLQVDNTSDPEGSPLTYSFRVYTDALLTSVVSSVDGVPAGPGFTSWRVMPPLPAGATYWWRAFASDGSLRGPFSAARSFTVQTGSGVASTAGEGITSFQPASPNPFSGRTSVRFSVPREGRIRADIFDATGRRVRSLYRGVMPDGFQTLVWDGRDETGRSMPSGVYFMIVESETHRESIKLTLVR